VLGSAFHADLLPQDYLGVPAGRGAYAARRAGPFAPRVRTTV